MIYNLFIFTLHRALMLALDNQDITLAKFHLKTKPGGLAPPYPPPRSLERPLTPLTQRPSDVESPTSIPSPHVHFTTGHQSPSRLQLQVPLPLPFIPVPVFPESSEMEQSPGLEPPNIVDPQQPTLQYSTPNSQDNARATALLLGAFVFAISRLLELLQGCWK